MTRQVGLMVLCCALPLAFVFALPYLGTPVRAWLLAAVLLCPVLMLITIDYHGRDRSTADRRNT